MSAVTISSDSSSLNLDKLQVHMDLSTGFIGVLNSSLQLSANLNSNYTTNLSLLGTFSIFSGILSIKKDLKDIAHKIKTSYIPSVANSITKLARDALNLTGNACAVLLGINTIYLSSTNKTPSFLLNRISQVMTNIGTIAGIASAALLTAQSFTMIAKSIHLYMKLGSFSSMQRLSEILGINPTSTDKELEKISERLQLLSGVNLSKEDLKNLSSDKTESSEKMKVFDDLKSGLKKQITQQIYSFIIGSITLALATINTLASNIIGVALQAVSLLILARGLWNGTKDLKEMSSNEAKNDSLAHKLVLFAVNTITLGSLITATVLSGGTAPCAVLLTAVTTSLLANSFLYLMTRNVKKQENAV